MVPRMCRSRTSFMLVTVNHSNLVSVVWTSHISLMLVIHNSKTDWSHNSLQFTPGPQISTIYFTSVFVIAKASFVLWSLVWFGIKWNNISFNADLLEQHWQWNESLVLQRRQLAQWNDSTYHNTCDTGMVLLYWCQQNTVVPLLCVTSVCINDKMHAKMFVNIDKIHSFVIGSPNNDAQLQMTTIYLNFMCDIYAEMIRLVYFSYILICSILNNPVGWAKA